MSDKNGGMDNYVERSMDAFSLCPELLTSFVRSCLPPGLLVAALQPLLLASDTALHLHRIPLHKVGCCCCWPDVQRRDPQRLLGHARSVAVHGHSQPAWCAESEAPL